MRIVIPSYDRHLAINDKSIRVLLDAGYMPEQIDVFVANMDEYEKYRLVLDKGISIIVGEKGLKKIREFIFRYYEEGTQILCLDDDIEMIKMKNPDMDEKSSWAKQELLDLKKEVRTGFDECIKTGKHIWGLYPVNNNFFMKNTISYDYKFIIGNFFGLIVNKEANQLSVGELDDYERSIRHYLLDGGVVRLNYLVAKTKFKKNKGGANALEFNREERMVLDQKLLCEHYPRLVYLKKKKDGSLNPMLKDMRDVKYDLNHYEFALDHQLKA